MTGKTQSLMTAPVLASRFPVFAPSIRQGKMDWHVKTKWGTAFVTGDITQIHRGILDAIFAHAIDSKVLNTGAIEILFDPFVITKVTHSSRDYQWLAGRDNSIFRDMQVAIVEIVEKNGNRHVGGIISEWRESKRHASMPGGVLTGDRALLAVTISAAWMRLYNSTLTVDYRDLIPAISSLKSGVLQALVRFCLTHRNMNMQLDDILGYIGAVDETTQERTIQRVIKAVCEADLSKFGIQVKNRIVFYKQHASVRFKNRVADTTCAGSDANCAANDTTCAGIQEFQELQELLKHKDQAQHLRPHHNRQGL